MSVERLFRAEAIAHHGRRDRDGDILRIDDRWTRVAYRVAVGAALTALVFSAVVPVREYASGPAGVRFEGRRELAASVPGVAEELTVEPGQSVSQGQVLVRLHDDEQSDELARATTEFEMQLARLLRDPTDAVAKSTLAGLHGKVEEATNALP